MGLQAGIWVSRLGFGPQDWNLGLETGILEGTDNEEEEKEEEKEKIPHMCESIGHRPLRGRCPKALASAISLQPGGQCKPGRVEMPKLVPGCTLASRVGPQSVPFFKFKGLIALS